MLENIAASGISISDTSPVKTMAFRAVQSWNTSASATSSLPASPSSTRVCIREDIVKRRVGSTTALSEAVIFARVNLPPPKDPLPSWLDDTSI